MKKTALAGALALAVIGTVCFSIQGITPAAAQDVVITDLIILRLKGALRLSPEQEAHWRALEAYVRKLAQHSSRDEDQEAVQHIRIRSYVLDGDAVDRFKSAAMPLIASLNDEQRRQGKVTAQALGIGSLFSR